MEIEQIAAAKPEALAKVPVDPATGVDEAAARAIVTAARFPAEIAAAAAEAVARLWETFVAEDALLVEVNPLVRDRDNRVIALDGKVTLDDNARFRHTRHGGVKPANFLDIGGGASADVMANGLGLILSDPDVRSVLVNVFGGITACDAVADGIVRAFRLLESRGDPVNRPLVVRLDGNNAEQGRAILDRADLPGVRQVDSMDSAAEAAAELAAAGV